MVNIGGFLGGMAGGASISIVVRAYDQYSRELKRAQREVAKTGAAVSKFGKAMKWAGVIGAGALVIGLVKATQVASEFQHEMTKAMIMFTDVTSTQRKSAEDLAIALSKDLGVAANEVAKSFWFLGSAGMSVEQSLKALPSTMLFARVNMLDTASATQFAMTMMKVFNVEAQDLEKYLDQATLAMKSHMLSMGELAEAFTYVAPQAQLMGIEFSELSSILGALADKGIKGSMAGRMMRRMLLRLAAPTSEARKEIESLGVEIFNSEGEMRNILDIIADFKEALGGLTQEQRIAKEEAIAGTIAFTGFEGLLSLSAGTLRRYVDEVENADGSMKGMEKTLKEDLNVQFDILKAGVKAIAIDLGNKFIPVLTDSVNGISQLIDISSKWTEHLKKDEEAVKGVTDEGITFIDVLDKITNKITGQALPSLREYLVETGKMKDEFYGLSEAGEKVKSGTDEIIPVTKTLTEKYIEWLDASNNVKVAIEEIKNGNLEAIETYKDSIITLELLEEIIGDEIKYFKDWGKEIKKTREELTALGQAYGKGYTTGTTGEIYTSAEIQAKLSAGPTFHKGFEDFIMRPGQKPIAFDPADTIVGTKGGGTGATITVGQIVVQGTGRDGNQIAREIFEKLTALGGT